MQLQGKSMTTQKKIQISNPRFVIGDLVHVPSNVVLWSNCATNLDGWTSTRTEIPTTGVVIEELADTVIIFVQGRRMSANKRHIYPYKEATSEGN